MLRASRKHHASARACFAIDIHARGFFIVDFNEILGVKITTYVFNIIYVSSHYAATPLFPF